ncbi:ankyrin repeat domain-containing protein [Marinobacter salarius]|uniref:ankyrin repeat domain-containing protein n=1 Tax=Marinobacter salarius TaxID=1420917 RepID=UPI0018F26393|nr:ankyrin repeat domain-containing protein [Marinobacter salarius]MBJ7276249.1 ankyrin repeat domain-containing protein [Marinobacter salarius]
MALRLNILFVLLLIIMSGCALLPIEAVDVERAVKNANPPELRRIYNSDFDLSKSLDEQGNNALHIAAISQHHWLFEELEREGALPFETNNEGQSPVSIIYQTKGDEHPGNWAIRKLDESRDIASGILSNIKNNYLSLEDFEQQLRLSSFELNVTGVGKTEHTLALALLEAGELSYLTALLEVGGSFDSQYGDTQRPMIAAVESGNEKSVSFAAKHGGNINARIKVEDRWISLLTLAIIRGDLAVARVLIGNGANVNASQGPDYLTPLHIASAMGSEAFGDNSLPIDKQIELIDLLLTNGAVLQSTDGTGATPLFYAAESGRARTVQFLLEKGADPNARKNDMTTPVSVAAMQGNSEVVKVLEKTGADLIVAGNNGSTLLHSAAAGGDLETVKMLMNKAPESALARTAGGETPIILAILEKHVETAELLAAANTESLRIAGDGGWTPLHYVLNNKRAHILDQRQRIRLTGVLVNAGAPLEAKTEYGFTPLYLAVYNSMSDVLPVLTKAGAKIDIVEPEHGFTPLMRAARNDDLKSLELLLKAGANVNAVDKRGRTALHHLASRSKSLLKDTYAKMTRRLIGWGADVDAQDNQSRTPLMVAAESGNAAVIKALMTSNANPFLRNELGETAELIAWEDDNYEIVRLIRYLSSLYEG